MALTAEQTNRIDELAAEGKGRRVIARELGVSPWAVRVYLESKTSDAEPTPAEPETTEPETPAEPERPTIHATREAWLAAAVEEMRPWFDEVGAPIPATVLVSVGFPSRKGLAARNMRIGECWHASGQDGVPHVFITPLIGDSTRVLDVLLHELVHAAGMEGHGADFKRVAVALGLTGKMTATVAGEELERRLEQLADKLGRYPHMPLKAGIGGPKKQTTRMIKAMCPECGCVIRMTRMWIEDVGTPMCACGGGQMQLAD